MSLRVIAVLIILLVVIGMPTQFATTIGIVGAGITVAIKTSSWDSSGGSC